jgi:hypothetical protein
LKPTWLQMAAGGFDPYNQAHLATAALRMKTDARTAQRRLLAAHDTLCNGNRYDGTREAKHAAGYREGSRFPGDCIELSDRIADHDRNRYYGPVTNTQRNLLASGMPYADITPRDGHSRADADLSAAQRYHDRLTP